MLEVKSERGNSKIALKAGFWYVFSTFLTKGLAFITTPIFARLMTENDYGEFSNFANWQSILLIIFGVEIYNTLSRAYYDYTDEYDQYSSTVTIISFFLIFAAYFVFQLCGNWIYNIVSIPKQFVNLMFFTMLFQACKQIYLTKERTLYRYKTVAIISILSLGIPTVLSVILTAIVPEADRLAGRMYGFYIPYAFIGVYCTAVLLWKGKSFNRKYIKYAFVLAVPLQIHYLTTYLLTSTNTIITKSVLGAETAAAVSITTSITNILVALFQAVTGALTTWVMDKLEQKEYAQVRKCGTVFAGITAVIAIGIMLLGPEAIWIFGSSKYANAAGLIPGLISAVFLQTVATLFTIILTYDKNVVRTAIVTGFVAVVSIAIKALCLASYGIKILPIINMVSFAVIFIANCILVYRAGYGECIDLRAFAMISVSVLAVMISCYFLYNHFAIRCILIGICAATTIITLYKTKNRWMKLLKKRTQNNTNREVR